VSFLKRLAMGEPTRHLFSALQDRYASRVFQEALRLTRNHADAEDLSQDLWIRVWRHLANGKIGDSAPLGRFLQLALGRLYLNLLRSRRGRPQTIPLEPDWAATGPSPEEEALARWERKIVFESIDTLMPLQREAVILHDLEGWPYDALPGKSSTWRNRRRRGVQGMQRHVRDRYPQLCEPGR
jgi:RNA polymerase sigma-70 factor, ECF subfamily